jgi:uncharacterized membrane protein YkvA (DUF1232 family)
VKWNSFRRQPGEGQLRILQRGRDANPEPTPVAYGQVFTPANGSEQALSFTVPQLAVGLGLLLVAWAGVWVAAVLLTRVLPDGVVKSAISLLPSTLTLLHRLIRSESVPRRARVILLLGFLYAVSPVTIIPDFVPVIGKVDNVLALVLALRWSSKMIPSSVLLEAWPGNPSQLRLLVGKRAAETAATETT